MGSACQLNDIPNDIPLDGRELTSAPEKYITSSGRVARLGFSLLCTVNNPNHQHSRTETRAKKNEGTHQQRWPSPSWGTTRACPPGATRAGSQCPSSTPKRRIQASFGSRQPHPDAPRSLSAIAPQRELTPGSKRTTMRIRRPRSGRFPRVEKSNHWVRTTSFPIFSYSRRPPEPNQLQRAQACSLAWKSAPRSRVQPCRRNARVPRTARAR